MNGPQEDYGMDVLSATHTVGHPIYQQQSKNRVTWCEDDICLFLLDISLLDGPCYPAQFLETAKKDFVFNKKVLSV